MHKLLMQPVSQGQEFIAIATDQDDIVRASRFDEDNDTTLYPEATTAPARQEDR